MANNINYERLSDAELLTLLKAGDEVAFTQIHDKCWEDLYYAAYKRLPDEMDCKSILQDVFMDLWTYRYTRDIENLKAYLYIAVRNKTFKYLDQKKKIPIVQEGFDELLSSSESTDARLIEKEIRAALELHLASFPKKRKDVYNMHYEEGLSTAEIAEKLGISRKTVQNHIHTVHTALRIRFARLTALSVIVASFLAMVFHSL